MENHELGTARRRDARAAVEGADRGRELPAARLEMPHESEEGCTERDVLLARELAEALCERVVHPEPAFEVDLARRVASAEEDLDRFVGRSRDGSRAGPMRIETTPSGLSGKLPGHSPARTERALDAGEVAYQKVCRRPRTTACEALAAARGGGVLGATTKPS